MDWQRVSDVPDCYTRPSCISNEYLQEIAELCKQEFTWIADSKFQLSQDRVVAWFAECGCSYNYNHKRQPIPSSPSMDWFLSFTKHVVKAAQLEHIAFNSCNINWYKSGQNSLTWHQDDEDLFRFSPQDVVPILSLSVGAPRNFLLRKIGESKITSTPLSNGDLLFMGGLLQSSHRHKVSPSACEEWRLNFTWRVVVNPFS